MTTREKMSRAEFEAFVTLPSNVERVFELINGELIEKMPTQLHALISLILAGALYNFLRNNPVGWAFVEARYGLPDDKDNDLIPDLSYVRKERGPVVERGAAPYMPDLAVEIQSPDDSLIGMTEKAAYYLKNGSRLVWLVYPRKKVVEVLTNDSKDILTLEDTLTGGDVLPGFTLPLSELFRTE